jgi:hypothetical protein
MGGREKSKVSMNATKDSSASSRETKPNSTILFSTESWRSMAMSGLRSGLWRVGLESCTARIAASATVTSRALCPKKYLLAASTPKTPGPIIM